MPDEGAIELPSGWIHVRYEAGEAYVHFHILHETTGGNSGLYQKLTPKTAFAIAAALDEAAKRAIGPKPPISDGAVCG